jgi:DNA-directed RNA polymerase specialized sigma subunit
MRNLKTGLNAPFYKWIDDVKKAIRHKRELEVKLEYYQSRLTGYQAVVYDSIGSSSSRNNVEDNLLFIIGKIDQIKYKVDLIYLKIQEYQNLKKKLSKQGRTLLEYLIETNLSIKEITFRMLVSRSRVYVCVNEISKFL